MNDNDKLPEGALIKVEVELRLPAPATDDQVHDWINFGLLQRGSISGDNPLHHFGPEPFGALDMSWEYTGKVGRREEYDVVPTENGGRRYKVRWHREAPSALSSTKSGT